MKGPSLFEALPASAFLARRRNRSRDDAGKSQQSWKKHRHFRRALNAQFNAFDRKHPKARKLILDLNAGDGEGVPLAQLDLFQSETLSRTTAEMAIAYSDRADVILCEKDGKRRKKLRDRFGGNDRVRILANHELIYVPSLAEKYDYVLVLSDPCGPAGHGEWIMAEISRSIRYVDFIIAINLHGVNRIKGTHLSPDEVGITRRERGARLANVTSRQRHNWKTSPKRWQRFLGRQHMISSGAMRISSTFIMKMLVISDFPMVKGLDFEVLS